MFQVTCATEGCEVKLWAKDKRTKYCPDCSDALRRERKGWMNRPSAVPKYHNGLTIVNDPLEVGGFSTGAWIPAEQCRLMSEMKSWTPGTLVRDFRGKEFIIFQEVEEEVLETEVSNG